jgi:NitT/TauT family transport system permease protein
VNDLATDAAEATPGPTVWTEHESWTDRAPRSVAMAAIFVAFVSLWQLIHGLELVSNIILPSPWETAQELVVVGQGLLTGGYLLAAFWITTQEVLVGFLIATTVGFLLGVLVGETALGERAVLPYLVAIDTMPKVAFAPLFISWLGFGIASKVALAAFVATFPVVVGTAAGLHAADENARMLFRTMGASRVQTLVKLKIPTGLPHIFTGLKIAAIGVVAGAITAEFLGGGTGMGHLIRTAASQLDTPRVFALILYLSVLGLATFWSVVWLQRRLVFWHKTTGRQDQLG